MLTDWVEGSSQSYTKNPDYWSYDEKYPENRLPYIGKLERLSGGAPGTRPTRSTSAELCIGVSSPVNSKQRQGTADRVGEVYRYLITRLTRRPFLRPVTEHCGLSERTWREFPSTASTPAPPTWRPAAAGPRAYPYSTEA